MKIRLEVSWTMSGTMEVEADSIDEAMKAADELPLPSGEYVPDSWKVDGYSIDGGELVMI